MNKSQVKTASRLLGVLIFMTLVGGFHLQRAAVTAQEIVAETIDVVSIDSVSVDDGASAEPLKSVSDPETSPRQFTMSHAIQITALLSIFLIGYSLWMNGKNGRGWFAVAIAFGMLTVIAKVILSMFVEVTNPYSPPDWDEE